jgi:hypothetical protein
VWFTVKLFGVEIFDITLGFADREERDREGYVSNTGGSFELAGETEAEWEPSEDWEEEEDESEKLGRRPPFGFIHA